MHLPLRRISSPSFILVCIVLLGLGARALFLESLDLIDPTEARYAAVAQEMVRSGDWLTPKLPMPEGTVPYLGKPPLHFWLTALSYTLFGVDEWSSRLPSFCGTVILLLTIYLVAHRFLDRVTAWSAPLVLLSAVVPFAVAGGSVTDVTLTVTITVAVASFFTAISSTSDHRIATLGALALGLGFLTKGPIAIVLTVLPFLLVIPFFKELRTGFRAVPWRWCALMFAGTTLPWFIANELANPGFLKYFVWNENIARYLFKEYGDRYGSGHVYPRGTAWIMLAIGFLPWTPIWLGLFWKDLRTRFIAELRGNPALAFVCAWSVTAPLFFTFVRQLHGLYILPALPPLALLTARFVALIIARRAEASDESPHRAAGKTFRWISSTSLVTMSAYGIAFLLLTPLINDRRSTEAILERIAQDRWCAPLSSTTPRVAVSTRNTFSHYWIARAWEEELPAPVHVEYREIDDLDKGGICYYLSKDRRPETQAKIAGEGFTLREQFGDWGVYRKTEMVG